jgi:predicted GNAT family acetyltransferase
MCVGTGKWEPHEIEDSANVDKRRKEMIKQNKGFWFSAVLDHNIVGSLGIFIDGDVARFQIVSTDPKYQRQGVCSTLVYKSAKYILRKIPVNTLVMVADEDYHAAKIYESVGFKPTEKQIGLCWFDKDKHLKNL